MARKRKSKKKSEPPSSSSSLPPAPPPVPPKDNTGSHPASSKTSMAAVDGSHRAIGGVESPVSPGIGPSGASGRVKPQTSEDVKPNTSSYSYQPHTFATGSDYWQKPADRFADQMGVLRVLLYILRGIDILSTDSPRAASEYFELATNRAQDFQCWPLMAFCAELKALVENRKRKPDLKVVEGYENKARSYRRLKIGNDVMRWAELIETIKTLRIALQSSPEFGEKILEADIREQNLAKRRNQRALSLRTEPHSPSSNQFSACTTRTKSSAKPSAKSLGDELGSDWSRSEGDRSLSLDEALPLFPVPPGSKSQHEAAPIIPRASTSRPAESGSPSSPTQTLQSTILPSDTGADSTSGPPNPKSPLSPGESAISSAVQSPHSPRSPGAAKVRRRRSSHVVGWEQPRAKSG